MEFLPVLSYPYLNLRGFTEWIIESKVKHGRTFFNAWKMSADFLQCVESARHDRSATERTAFKGIFRLIERFNSLHWVIAP